VPIGSTSCPRSIGARHDPAALRLSQGPGGRDPGAGARASDRRRLPTEGLIAHVMVANFSEHLPLYRQSQVLARHGVTVDRSTLAYRVDVAAWHLRPVVDRMAET
jgi:transposase